MRNIKTQENSFESLMSLAWDIDKITKYKDFMDWRITITDNSEFKYNLQTMSQVEDNDPEPQLETNSIFEILHYIETHS